MRRRTRWRQGWPGLVCIVLAAGAARGAEGGKGNAVVPRSDEDVIKVLVDAAAAKPYVKPTEALSKIGAARVRSGIAFALLHQERREATLRYLAQADLAGSRLDPALVPIALETLKFSRGEQHRTIMTLLARSKDKAILPVVLDYLDFQYFWGGNPVPDSMGRVTFSPEDTLFNLTVPFLFDWSDGAIGRAQRPPRGRETVEGDAAQMQEWRDWWTKNAGDILPAWRPEDIGATEAAIRKWCAQKMDWYGPDATGEVEKIFDESLPKIVEYDSPAPSFWPGKKGYSLLDPAALPVMMLKVLDTAGKLPATLPAAPTEADQRRTITAHRLALISLAYTTSRPPASLNRWPVAQFLSWAQANGQIRDLRIQAFALGHTPCAETAQALVSLTRQNIPQPVLLEAFYAMGEQEREEPIALLAEYLAAETPVGDAAANALDKIGRARKDNWDTISAAAAPLLTTKNVRVARRALRLIGSPTGLKLLREALPAMLPEVQSEAQERLKYLEEVLNRPAETRSGRW